PLSPDHLLTHVSPTSTPTRVSFHRRTTRMVVRTQPTLSSGMLACIAEVATLSPPSFCKIYRSSYETSSSSSPTLLVRKRYRERGSQGLDNEGHGLSDEDHGLDDESLGLKDEGLGLEGEEAAPEGRQQAVLFVGTATREPLGLEYEALRRHELAEGVERISEFRHPTLVTWIDTEDDRVYTDIRSYAPPVAPVQTSPSPEWSLSSLPVSPSSPLVPSPIASPMATSIANISIDEDQFIKEWLEMRSSHRERVDTRLANMSRDRYDDHRLIHDMLMQQAAMQRMLQEMRGRVTTLEQERDRRQ
nr:hypothetical protein [Tanacetum cinerariifolium]